MPEREDLMEAWYKLEQERKRYCNNMVVILYADRTWELCDERQLEKTINKDKKVFKIIEF